ncbi:unnamed protein product, partial [Cladocopium goreaui]
QSVQLVEKYVDSKGINRVKGSRFLKGSQAYTRQFGRALARLRTRHQSEVKAAAAAFLCKAAGGKQRTGGLVSPALNNEGKGDTKKGDRGDKTGRQKNEKKEKKEKEENKERKSALRRPSGTRDEKGAKVQAIEDKKEPKENVKESKKESKESRKTDKESRKDGKESKKDRREEPAKDGKESKKQRKESNTERKEAKECKKQKTEPNAEAKPLVAENSKTEKTDKREKKDGKKEQEKEKKHKKEKKSKDEEAGKTKKKREPEGDQTGDGPVKKRREGDDEKEEPQKNEAHLDEDLAVVAGAEKSSLKVPDIDELIAQLEAEELVEQEKFEKMLEDSGEEGQDEGEGQEQGEEEEKEIDQEVAVPSTTALALKKLDESDESMDDEAASDPSSHDSSEESSQSSQETVDDETSNDDADTAPAPASSKGDKIDEAAGSAVDIPAQRANSRTNKKEWDTFSREVLNKKKFPVRLSEHLARDKVDLFNLWLAHGKDLHEVALHVERTAETVNRTASGREGMKLRDIEAKYPPEKAKKLATLLRSRGMWYWDPDFPNDEEEIFYYTGKARSVSTENLTKESMTLKGVTSPDETTLAALTGESGPLAAGALPQMDVSQAEGDKNTWETLMEAPVAKRKAKPRTTQEPAVPVEPKQAKDAASEALTQAAIARKLSLSLKGVEYSGELTTQLMDCSKKLERLYELLQGITADDMDEQKINKYLHATTVQIQWLEKAKVAGQALTRGLNAKPRPKNKAKAKAAPEKGSAEPAKSLYREKTKTKAVKPLECTCKHSSNRDGQPVDAVAAFASLGSFGTCASNQERDMHRWLRNLHGTNLDMYYTPFELEVRDETDTKTMLIPTLLPHEILHAVAAAGQEQVFDIKFPSVILAYESMKSYEVRKGVHRRVCELWAWSLSCAAAGVFPTTGLDGEEFDPKSYRYKMRGLPLARGGAYFAARYDAKARVETNNFLRHYGCSLICEQCLASKISKTTDDRMCYKDFRLESPRWLTRINHDTYMRTTPPRAISPWHIIPGWSLESCLHDIMHVVYLGTGRDLVASLLGDFLECGVLGPPHLSVDHRLRLFSIEMNKFFKSEKISVRKLQFTAKNTGLGTNSEYPELGSAWKAAHVKVLLGYMACKAVQFASETGDSRFLRL